jgi:hypothetical protein
MQRARLKRLDRFKATSNAVLVATDVAGRGLDIKGVEFVVNYQVAQRATRNATQCADVATARVATACVATACAATACAATWQAATSCVATGAALLRRLRAPRGPHCSDPPRRPDRALPFPLSAIPT